MHLDINVGLTAELQQLLNISVAHIRKQGRGSSRPDKDQITCTYRNEDGSGCAAGPFINNYYPTMESLHFLQLAERFGTDLDPLAAKHASFVCNVLQQAHDGAAHKTHAEPDLFLADYEERLRIHVAGWNRAHRTNLVIPEAAP